jgi:8-oxo-dGTP pyrophosphatase MutT (NUDIX family)
MFTIKGVTCISAGIVFWRFRNNRAEVLLQFSNDKKSSKLWFEDFGGKREPTDPTIMDVAAREAAEETNAAWTAGDKKKSQDLIRGWLDTRSRSFINRQSRYALFLVHCPLERDVNFGDHETGLPFVKYRIAEWIPFEKFLSLNVNLVHPRIRHFWRSISEFGVDRYTTNHVGMCKGDLTAPSHTPKLIGAYRDPIAV